jgi:nucleoside-diphosphate-sugar epimerase
VADDRETFLSEPMNAEAPVRKILVFGASGLIGRFVTDDLRARGFCTIGVARNFLPSQRASALDPQMPILSMDVGALARWSRPGLRSC